MTAYLVRRLLLVIPTLLVVMLLVFSILRLLPGDVVKLMVAEQNYAADEDAMRRELGLDKPVPVQFAQWTGDVFAVLIGLLIALPVGVVSAVLQDGWLDYGARSIAIFLISVPGFWLATLLL